MWDLISMTRDQTRAPRSGSTEPPGKSNRGFEFYFPPHAANGNSKCYNHVAKQLDHCFRRHSLQLLMPLGAGQCGQQEQGGADQEIE